jgi:thiaminase
MSLYDVVSLSSVPSLSTAVLNAIINLSRYNIENCIFREWLQFYSSSESCIQVKDLKNILCALAKEASNKDKLVMKRYFATACNYELLFWDMAYNSTIA